MTAYIITAPHSLCIRSSERTSERTCDERSEQAAKMIQKGFQDLGVPESNIYLLLSDTIRKEMDLNRIESFTSEWRQKLRNLVSPIDLLKNDFCFFII